jgi:hypothetical protein
MLGLAESIKSATFGVVDSSDMLRSALVQIVAALDHYVHGIVLDRGVEIAMGRLPYTSSGKLGLPLSAVADVNAATSAWGRELVVRTRLAERLSRETFQRADAIAQALAEVGVPRVWANAFPHDPAGTMTRLNLVVTRRNQIVHAGDADPLYPSAVTPILSSDASDAISTVEGIVTAIDALC